MRLIGSIPDQQRADRFGDYLITLDIDHSLEQNGDDRWDLWIADDDDIDRAKAELDQFLRAPDDPRYKVTRKAAAIRAEEEKKREKRRRNFIDVRTNWAFNTGSYPLTLTLIVICGIVAAATWIGGDMSGLGHWLYFTEVEYTDEGVVSPGLSLILHGQIWRIVTPMFVHFGIIHFIFNMFWLRDLGAMIEGRRGTWFLLALVLASSIVGNFAEYFWSGPLFGDPPPLFGGMSGVVYALFGYAWMKSRFEPHLNIHIGQTTIMIMLVWLAIAAVGVIHGVANAAHVAGLIVGVAIGYLPYRWRLFRRYGR